MIPNSVTYIGSRAFSGCSGLGSITLPFVGGSIKNANDTYQYPFGYIFGTNNYTGGTAIKQYYYSISSSSTSYTTSTTYYIPTSLKSVTITGGNILYGAFQGCRGLTSVTIGDAVTSIGSSAFGDCRELTSITIPDGVISIGGSAFSGCSSITSIYYTGNIASWCGISGLNNLISKTRTLYINNQELTGELVIPDSVTTIPSYAFYNCSGLTSVTIPASVTYISDYAFTGCSGLTDITFHGTMEQWNAITKGTNWNSNTGSYTIHFIL